MHPLAQLDHLHLWHPFTQMRDWLAREPVVIVSGKGPVLRDAHGKRYLDANSSIWTNLHGHAHPRINAAIQRQLRKIAHSSALGLASEPASILGARLVEAARSLPPSNTPSGSPGPVMRERLPAAACPDLPKVFFSDNGSTALEVALKLAYEYARRTGRARAPRFLSLSGAYHGDTVGAVSLGHIDLFHKAYQGLLFQSDSVMAPFCYRCPFNRAAPDRADARLGRRCREQCLDRLETRFAAAKKRGRPYSALVVEPLMQGAAGMVPQPAGWLRQAAAIARAHDAQLIADEVMTGFGRTGGGALFACQREGVRPDYLALAKGLTGGYLPMAATLTTQAVFDVFLGDYSEFKSFFHGHSYTGNQLGATAGLASLSILKTQASIRARARLEHSFHSELNRLWTLPQVGDIRQEGLVAGVELVRDWRTRAPFDLREKAGIRVCEEMTRQGVLTRPVGNVIVLMPPYCMTPDHITRVINTLAKSVKTVLGA